MDKLHQWGGAPSRPAQQLRRNVRRMLLEGWSPAAIRHEILTSPCTRKEQNKLLRELHMEEKNNGRTN